MNKEDLRENLLPVRISAKSREEVLAPVRMTKEEREERAPVRITREEKEDKAPIRMSKEEKENQAPYIQPTRLGEKVRVAEKPSKEELQPRSNTASSWSRRQDELEVQIQQNRRKSQDFEDRSRRSEESLRKTELDNKQRREEKMMSDDLARVKVEQSHRRDD